MTRSFALLAVILLAGSSLAAAACGPPARSNSEACIARAQIQRTLDSLARADLENLNETELQGDLATLRNGVERAGAAVRLPQNVELRKLGGLPYLQALSSRLVALMAEVARVGPGSTDVARVQADLATDTRSAQQVVDSIKGC